MYEKVSDYGYLRANLCTKDDWSKEINIQIDKFQKQFYGLIKFLRMNIMSLAIIGLILIYEYKIVKFKR